MYIVMRQNLKLTFGLPESISAYGLELDQGRCESSLNLPPVLMFPSFRPEI